MHIRLSCLCKIQIYKCWLSDNKASTTQAISCCQNGIDQGCPIHFSVTIVKKSSTFLTFLSEAENLSVFSKTQGAKLSVSTANLSLTESWCQGDLLRKVSRDRTKHNCEERGAFGEQASSRTDCVVSKVTVAYFLEGADIHYPSSDWTRFTQQDVWIQKNNTPDMFRMDFLHLL